MRDITLCHPRLQKLITQLTSECTNAGLPIKIGESFRSVAEQDALYAQGRTQPGSIVTNAKGSSYSSQHQWGIAADFYRADGKGAYNEAGDYFNRVGAIAKQLGLAWGGDWKSIVDKPHVYLPDWGSGTGILKQKYGTFEAFKKTWVMDGGTVTEQPGTPQVSVSDLKEVKSGIRGLRVTASSLIIRTTPKGTDTGKRYNKDQRVQPINKCFAGGDPWIQTADGWVSGKYLTGWVCQDGRWWYLLSGYTYRHDTVCQIDGQAYAFDSEGWMITADRIADDGHIK
ncbi:M15 family metallopeptidase [Clostridium fessum]|uniref:M15 family metallopeptidase n=1 Tax=Clostridium fessum TaxID=2126740 RepID=UPI0022DE9F62|nr:M15 family metallopeptidase [Clostridium fessum]